MDKPSIVILGSNGQLGQSFQALSNQYSAYTFTFLSRSEADIFDEKQMEAVFNQYSPAFVINCAAYTAVDRAEEEIDACNSINWYAVKLLAQMCKEHHSKLVHYSSDYVYDQQHQTPYTEDDAMKPRGVYAHSKMMGDQSILDTDMESVILRTSWVYAPIGHNFVRTMLRLSETKDELSIVNDQIGAPTFTYDIVRATMTIIQNWHHRGTEVYNFSNYGEISWYDFALGIFQSVGKKMKVNPIPSSSYPTAAKRPHNSRLNLSKIAKDYGIAPIYWKESLCACLRLMHHDK